MDIIQIRLSNVTEICITILFSFCALYYSAGGTSWLERLFEDWAKEGMVVRLVAEI